MAYQARRLKNILENTENISAEKHTFCKQVRMFANIAIFLLAMGKPSG
jgi:hypothetical protein